MGIIISQWEDDDTKTTSSQNQKYLLYANHKRKSEFKKHFHNEKTFATWNSLPKYPTTRWFHRSKLRILSLNNKFSFLSIKIKFHSMFATCTSVFGQIAIRILTQTSWNIWPITRNDVQIIRMHWFFIITIRHTGGYIFLQ